MSQLTLNVDTRASFLARCTNHISPDSIHSDSHSLNYKILSVDEPVCMALFMTLSVSSYFFYFFVEGYWGMDVSWDSARKTPLEIIKKRDRTFFIVSRLFFALPPD